MADPYKQLATRLHEIARTAARRASPPQRRFKVRKATPLVLEEIEGDLVLEEGDPDLEIDERLKPGVHVDTPAGQGTRNEGSLPETGDVVIVEHTRDGDYVASKLVKGG